MRRSAAAALAAIAAVAPLLVTVPAQARPARALRFPAHHTVQDGEWLWQISRDFLTRFYAEFDYRVPAPSERAIGNEVRQIRRLNRDALRGQGDTVYPGQRLLLARTAFDVPDGKDGWGTGFTVCTGDAVPRHSRTPYDDLSVSIRLVDAPVDRRHEHAVITLRNDGTHPRHLTTQLEHAALVSPDGRTRGAVVLSDAIGVAARTLAPQEAQHIRVSVDAFTCGDVRVLSRRLPAGRYRLVGFLHWSAGRHRDGDWVTAPRGVRVTR